MAEKRSLEIWADETTRRRAIAGLAFMVGGVALGSTTAWAGDENVISHESEAIHQEASFAASRKRVYDALTDSGQFDKVVQLSAAMKSIPQGGKPTKISNQEGGAFSLFGGYITGRQIELVPNERIVQAWRAATWEPGIFSVVRFQLTEQGAGTKIIFDHTGFPKGQSAHLAAGWKDNYWEPLGKMLA
jgi:uncharacterized protein YndB with AHSA1/START domain